MRVLGRWFDSIHDRVRTRPRRIVLAALAGAIIGGYAGVRRGDDSAEIALNASIGFSVGLLAGLILVSVDSYEERVARDRLAGVNAPSDTKMMILYAVWIIAIIVAMLAASALWIMWPTF